jgi:hypothetical protein
MMMTKPIIAMCAVIPVITEAGRDIYRRDMSFTVIPGKENDGYAKAVAAVYSCWSARMSARDRGYQVDDVWHSA